MLHYNYPLFLQYPGGGDDTTAGSEDLGELGATRYLGPGTPAPAAPKSFTIAAILGLEDGREQAPTDLTVVNLSVHQGVAERLQDCRTRLPIRPLPPAYPRGPCQRPKKHPHPTSSSTTPGHAGGSKNKRVRTIFTPEQLERLEAEFERQQYMVGPERLYLAHTLQLTEAQVKVWFQNRRIKWRKHHLEVTQQRLAAIKQRQIMASSSGTSADGPDVIDDTSSDATDT